MIAFLEGNSKISLQQAVDQVPYYHCQPSIWTRRENCGGNRPRNVQFPQFFEVQKVCDLDLASGQGQINIHSTCRATSMTNRVNVASHTTEIWPFEFCEILTFPKFELS